MNPNDDSSSHGVAVRRRVTTVENGMHPRWSATTLSVLDGVAAADPIATACITRLNAWGGWWRPSENEGKQAVWTCRQAVKYRERVGSGSTGGIPLWAELKSLVGQVILDDGSRLLFAAHTRANTKFETAKIAEALGFDPAQTRVEALISEVQEGEPGGEFVEKGEQPPMNVLNVEAKDEWFGRVNPFNVDIIVSSILGTAVGADEIVQIVDHSIDLDGGTPDTLMTNLGERTIALEIASVDLVNALESLSSTVKRADISLGDGIWQGKEGEHLRDYWLQLPPSRGPKIGILTGNGADSGRALWLDISNAVRSIYSFVPDVLAPEVVVHSLPAMGLSMELVDREDEVEQVVLGGIRALLGTGCTLITVACNTTIYFADEIRVLCDQFDAEFISIADACVPAIEAALPEVGESRQVGLIGIGPVVDLADGYSGYKEPLESRGLSVVPCPAERLAYLVKSMKPDDKSFVTTFTRLMRQMFPPEVKVVVLALTEVSLVYRQTTKDAPQRRSQRVYVDPLLELGRYLAYRYLLRGYLENAVTGIDDSEYASTQIRREFGWS
jgi:aspartate/glutamate racemase